MFITSRESAIVLSGPQQCSPGRSVSRAYINPLKPRLQAYVRVLWAFLLFFWIHGKLQSSQKSICCGLMLRGVYLQGVACSCFRVTRKRVTEVLETVPKYYVARGSACDCSR